LRYILITYVTICDWSSAELERTAARPLPTLSALQSAFINDLIYNSILYNLRKSAAKILQEHIYCMLNEIIHAEAGTDVSRDINLKWEYAIKIDFGG